MADVSKINGYNIKDATARAALDSKQDTISDLSTIRSGAALGATALQSVPSTYRTAAEQDIIDDTKSSVSVSVTGTATDVVKYIIIDGVEKKLPSSEISPEVLENFITAEDEDPSSPASKDADTLGGHIPAYYAQKEYVDTQLAQKYVKPSGGIPTADIANASITRAKVSSDVLCSPITNFGTSTYSIVSTDIGRTIWASGNNTTITLTSSVFTSLPTGTEIGLTSGGYLATLVIASGMNIRTRCGGQLKSTSTGITLKLEPWSTVALKKVSSTYLYIVGEAEVV